MTLTVVKTTALTGTITNAQLAGGIDLTAKVTGTLPIANGGTNSTATAFVNATTNVTGALPVVNGGTGIVLGAQAGRAGCYSRPIISILFGRKMNWFLSGVSCSCRVLLTELSGLHET